ncbi:hypothetical protein ACV229_15035 [Burkholderia sp. MR1-5-21]
MSDENRPFVPVPMTKECMFDHDAFTDPKPCAAGIAGDPGRLAAGSRGTFAPGLPDRATS